MPFVSFIYRIGKKQYFGKYVSGQISDDVDINDMLEGVVMEVLNKHLKNKVKKVKVGILGCSYNDYYNVTENEIKCFDFYWDEGYPSKYYINGKLINLFS
jgi:hypothetical protein